jgi:hypothetical protein
VDHSGGLQGGQARSRFLDVLMDRLFEAALVRFTPISLQEANDGLVAWGHKMGPLHRGNQSAVCHGLFYRDDLVAVTTASDLIAESNSGFIMRRATHCELSRLCASRSGLCRVALRLWREFVFPSLGYRHAISYQDADLHSGNTYRFDGWERVAYSSSGTDSRSGRSGRKKWIWVWPPKAMEQKESLTTTVGIEETNAATF